MGFERPPQQHHLVIAVVGVTIAFAAAAVGGQIIFRGRFGPASAAVASAEQATRAAATGSEATAAVSVQTQRVTLAAKQLGSEAADTAQLALSVPSSEQVKAKVQAGLDDAKIKAEQAVTAAAQQKWDEVKANTAAAALGAATTAGEKLASSPINDLKSPEAQRQAQAIGAASVGLWQSLWEVFVSLWHAFLGLFKK
jgi:hypothetical protein